MEKALHHTRARHPLNAEEVAWFLPHYSSGYFRDKVYAGLKNVGFELGFEKWLFNLPEKGNTGSASIYIMLDEFIRRRQTQKGEKILCLYPREWALFILFYVARGRLKWMKKTFPSTAAKFCRPEKSAVCHPQRPLCSRAEQRLG